METQHLSYFKIENFKRFDSFEMENLGQFNLIVGDNNVGKTSVMEGLCFDEDVEKTISNYFSTYAFRKMYSFTSFSSKEIQKSSFWKFIYKDQDKPIVIYKDKENEKFIAIYFHKTIDLINNDSRFVENNYTNGATEMIEQLNRFEDNADQRKFAGAYFETSNVEIVTPFISTNSSYDLSLPLLFNNYFNSSKNRRKEVEDRLRLFIPKIEDIRIHKFFADQDSLSVTLSDDDAIFPLSQFGDGTVKYTKLLLELIISQNGRIMIDEIGAGIHYTRLKDYWQTILQLCEQYKVQLFATTHSYECQQAFVEALESSEDMKKLQKEARNITMLETKSGDVKSVTYDFEQFENALNIGFNTRGGNI